MKKKKKVRKNNLVSLKLNDTNGFNFKNLFWRCNESP